MAVVGTAIVDFLANTSRFNSDVIKSEKIVTSSGFKIQKSMQRIEASVVSTNNGIKNLASAFLAFEGLQVGARALEYASGLGEISQQLGITVEDLQIYRFAATQVGVSQEEMEKGLGKLTQTLGKAQLGSKSSAEVFSALGVSIRDAGGKFRTTSDILPDLADAIARIPDPAKRAAVEVALFGRAGQKLDTLLSGGSAAIKAQAEDISSYGLVTREMADKADEAADKIARMKFQLETSFAVTVSENADSILRLADALQRLGGKSAEFVSQYPRLSAALIGAAAGSRAGPVGTVIGAVGGYSAADGVIRDAANANGDIGFRNAQLQEAMSEQRARQQAEKAPSKIVRFRRSGAETESLGVPGAVAEVQRQTALLNKAIAASRRPKTAAAPAALSLGGEDSLPDFLGGGAGGAGGGKKGGGGSAKSSNDAAAKLVADTKAFNDEIRQQIELLTLRNDGFTYAADLLEAQSEVERRFPQQAKETNDAYRARIAPLLATRVELLNVSEAAKQLTFDLNDGLALSGEAQARISNEWNIMLRELKIETDDKTAAISQSFTEMASNIDQALTSLASGIRSGGFLDILGGVLNLVTQLGSVGLFGSSVAKKLNAPGVKLFRSGGYTGGFGINDVAGVVHGQEYVFDAAAVRRIGLPALEALRAGQIAGYKSGGYVGSSSVARYINRAGVNDNGLRVQVVKGDLFDVIVDGRAASVAAPMVVAGSQAASVGAQRAVARKQSRRLA